MLAGMPPVLSCLKGCLLVYLFLRYQACYSDLRAINGAAPEVRLRDMCSRCDRQDSRLATRSVHSGRCWWLLQEMVVSMRQSRMLLGPLAVGMPLAQRWIHSSEGWLALGDGKLHYASSARCSTARLSACHVD